MPKYLSNDYNLKNTLIDNSATVAGGVGYFKGEFINIDMLNWARNKANDPKGSTADLLNKVEKHNKWNS